MSKIKNTPLKFNGDLDFPDPNISIQSQVEQQEDKEKNLQKSKEIEERLKKEKKEKEEKERQRLQLEKNKNQKDINLSGSESKPETEVDVTPELDQDKNQRRDDWYKKNQLVIDNLYDENVDENVNTQRRVKYILNANEQSDFLTETELNVLNQEYSNAEDNIEKQKVSQRKEQGKDYIENLEKIPVRYGFESEETEDKLNFGELGKLGFKFEDNTIYSITGKAFEITPETSEQEIKTFLSNNAELFPSVREANKQRNRSDNSESQKQSNVEDAQTEIFNSIIENKQKSETFDFDIANLSEIQRVNYTQGDILQGIPNVPKFFEDEDGNFVPVKNNAESYIETIKGNFNEEVFEKLKEKEEGKINENIQGSYDENLNASLNRVTIKKLNKELIESGVITDALPGEKLAELYPDKFKEIKNKLSDEYKSKSLFLAPEIDKDKAGDVFSYEKFVPDEIYDSSGEIINKELYNGYKNVLESDEVYKELVNITASQKNTSDLNERITDYIENQTENNIFQTSKTQKREQADIPEGWKDLDNESKKLYNTQVIVENENKDIELEYQKIIDWQTTNTPESIQDQVDKIKNQKYNTQEEVDAANKKINSIIKNYNNQLKANQEKSLELQQRQKANLIASLDLQIDFEDFQGSQEDFANYANLIDRNYQIGTQSVAAFTDSAIELVQGVGYAIEGLTIDSAKEIIGSESGFGDAGKKTLTDIVNEKVDEFQQEYLRDNVQILPSYEEIESFSDAAEWATVSFFQQAPQIALFTAAVFIPPLKPLALGILSASAGGNYYNELDQDAKLYDRTNGLYGDDIGFITSLTSGTGVAGINYLTERITFGQVKRVANIFKTPVGKQSVASYFRKNIFNRKSLYRGGLDLSAESISEGIATTGENAIAILNGDNIGLYDNVEASMVTGALVYGGVKSPVLFKPAITPFQTQNNKTAIDNNFKRISELGNQLLNKDLSFKHEEIKKEIAELTLENTRRIEEDIKRVDALNDNEKQDLINIYSDNIKLKEAYNELSKNKNIPLKEKEKDLNGILEKLNKNQVRKQQILDKYPSDIVKEQYKHTMKSVQKNADLIKKYGGPEVNVREGNTKQFGEVLQEAGVDPVYQTRYGGILPVLNEKGEVSSYDIFVNKETSLENGMFATGAHELVHAVMYQTLKQDMISQDAIGTSLLNAMNEQMLDNKGNLKKDAGLAEGSNFNERINSYSPQEGQGEEIVAITSEALLNKEINLSLSTIQKVRGIFRRFGQNYLGRDIKLDTDQDVLNFVVDYTKSIQSGIPNKAIAKMAAGGLQSNIIQQYQKDIAEKKNEAMFSKNVIQEIKSNPDIKQEFDTFVQNNDGTRKFDNKEDFQASTEFFPAYDKIVNSKVLDGLIMANVSDVVQPSQMSDFVTSVKEKIGDRFIKNFDAGKNESLFGWLTGVAGGAGQSIIYRAKGDVMNEYTKQVQAQSLEAQAEKSAQIESKADKSLEIFEELDLDAGKVKGPIGIKLYERLGPKAVEINKEVKSIASSMEVSNLNFKTLKDLTPELTQEMFGIKPKVGNLTKADIKNAQMFINKNVSTLIAMLPEGSTASGTSTGVQKVLLDAFYTKSDRAAMAKTGSKAGLAVQIKNDNITPAQFLEVFGITERGKPNLYKKDSNTSSRIKALVAQTGRMMTNQGVREHLIERQESLNTIQRIADGKSNIMFSKSEKRNFNIAQKIINLPTIRSEFDTGIKGIDKMLSTYGQEKTFKFKTEKDIDNYIVEIKKKLLPIMPKEFWFGPQGGTAFTSSNKIIGVKSSKDPLWKYYVSEFKKLAKDPDVKYGESIKGVKDFSVSSYSTLFKDQSTIEKSIKNGNVEKFNQKVSKIHKEMWSRFNDVIRNNPQQATIIGNYLKITANDTKHWHKLGAQFVGYSTNPKLRYEYEHAMPATSAYLYLLDAVLSGGNFEVSYELVMNNYKLIALDKAADKKLTAVGLQRIMPNNWDLIDNNWWDRYFNKLVGKEIGVDGSFGIDPASIKTIDGSNLAEQLNINKDGDARVVSPGSEVGAMFSKAVNNSRKINDKTPSRGMSAFDFDETLIDKGENTIVARKGDDVVEISSDQWPIQGPQLAKEGYDFDFSDFINVKGGVEGPLMQKFRNRIAKYGIENNYILTARPAESAPAIQAWLKTQGIDMPIENITGLGNSTGEAKAMWMAGKYAEGYNDMYFVDDALPNVEAVKDMMEQLDIKGSSVQAKMQFSKDLNKNFNDILEKTTGIQSQKVFSETQAKLRGRKTKYKSIVPASAQDFGGLIYNFLGKGKVGEKQMEFFKKALIDPFARGINELNASKQAAANDYSNLLKQYPNVKKDLKQNLDDFEGFEGNNFTVDQAVRVYLWNKAGFEVPGLSARDLNALDSFVKNDPELQAFADAVGLISKKEQGYAAPGEYWLTENINSDLMSDGAIGEVRADFLAEWTQNKNEIFNQNNLNKIEAIYGSKFVEALKDVLYRMETGRNRPTGKSRLTNEFMNWTNGSIGAIMFFNIRSAVLQTISSVNYINWTDNNPLKAAAAFANQKQYWSDFSTLFNSNYLKQRRAGNQRGINEAELSQAVAGKGAYEQAKAAIRYLLKIGFLPTQIADSFAIASGGATFYRNRIKKYTKQGMDANAAQEKAFLDFQETTEVSQQSARPDMISQQQADPMGRLILSFQNTPMQYARIMNKAARDLVNRRGDYKTHISKIIYYGAIQGVIFGALQSALFAAIGDEEEDKEMFDNKKERILNQMIDSVLSGLGYAGKAISTAKNTMLEYLRQRDKGYRADHAYTIIQALGFAPPIGSKARKIYSAIQTEKFNRDVFKKRGLAVDNPIWSAVGNIIEGTTNLPLGRAAQKLLNLENALDSQNETWERIALVLGWSTWDLGITDPDIAQVKEDIKEEKAILREQEKERKKKEKQVEEQIEKESKEKENIELQKQEKKEGKKVLCAAINKSGKRCGKEVLPGQTYCTIHEKVEQNETGEKKQCTKIKSNGDRCKMKTSNKSGLCYYHD